MSALCEMKMRVNKKCLITQHFECLVPLVGEGVAKCDKSGRTNGRKQRLDWFQDEIRARSEDVTKKTRMERRRRERDQSWEKLWAGMVLE